MKTSRGWCAWCSVEAHWVDTARATSKLHLSKGGQPLLNHPATVMGKMAGSFQKKWSSICKSFIFLGTNNNLASLAKYSSCVLNRSTYSSSLSGVGSPFSATSPWRSQSFMGITVQLFSSFPQIAG